MYKYSSGDLKKSSESLIADSSANSGGVKVKSLIPSENKAVLENDREITYDYLVLAAGMGQDFDAVPGLLNALKDEKAPVYSSQIFKS